MTVDLPEDASATEAATDRHSSFNEEEFPLDADALEKIRRGFADMDAGRTMSLEDSRTRIEALLAARHGNDDA